MIGFEYHGQVNYITQIEDFRDFMEPSVYEALVKALAGGLWDENWRQKYEELKADYDDLKQSYDELDDVSDELAECEERLENMENKFEVFRRAIEVLINQYYQKYIKQEDVIPTLEKLI